MKVVATGRQPMHRSLMFVFLLTGTLGFALGTWGSSRLWSHVAPAVPNAVHGHWTSFARTPNPKYGGSEGVIASAKGNRLIAGVFTHGGRYSYTFPFDEFAYVTSGSVTVTVMGQPPFELSEGHFVYFPKGTQADFVAGPNYANIAVLAGDSPIKW